MLDIYYNYIRNFERTRLRISPHPRVLSKSQGIDFYIYIFFLRWDFILNSLLEIESGGMCKTNTIDYIAISNWLVFILVFNNYGLRIYIFMMRMHFEPDQTLVKLVRLYLAKENSLLKHNVARVLKNYIWRVSCFHL